MLILVGGYKRDETGRRRVSWASSCRVRNAATKVYKRRINSLRLRVLIFNDVEETTGSASEELLGCGNERCRCRQNRVKVTQNVDKATVLEAKDIKLTVLVSKFEVSAADIAGEIEEWNSAMCSLRNFNATGDMCLTSGSSANSLRTLLRTD